MSVVRSLSQRLVRKGALAAETYALFSRWNPTASFEANLQKGLEQQFQTLAWEKEVRTTLRSRFRDPAEAADLIAMARAGLPFDEWRSCLLLWICIHEELFFRFIQDWLFPEYEAGRIVVRVEDVKPHVETVWQGVKTKGEPLTDYGITRAARDLIRLATDLGLLSGAGSVRRFATQHLSDRCFIYWVYRIAEYERSTAAIPKSLLWRGTLMGSTAVEAELLRLHQFDQLHYQAAGSLIQIALPCSSSLEFVERRML